MDWMVGSELENINFFFHMKYRKTEWQSTLKDCNAYMEYVNVHIIYRWLNILLLFFSYRTITQLVCHNTIYTISSDYKSTLRKQRQRRQKN